ncbi:MAG TPA: CtsR family transcriptional regulator [Syntrophomonadaceae bacterium]|nr:CtsR family transcriptional regulator [Syntrophomonadaceae bacterium]
MKKNISESIAQYIRTLIGRSAGQTIQIQRAELARTFNCAPSQVNYVIRTRFREADGYTIESRRGGQGFIRITRFHPAEIGFSYGELRNYIDRMERDGILTSRESEMLRYISRWGIMELPPQQIANFLHSITKAFEQILD